MSLISRKCVLNWIYGHGLWARGGCQPALNKLEKEWAHEILNSKTKMWSAVLGEQIVKDILEIDGDVVWRPQKLDRQRPDWETKEYLYEVKTRNWTTTGTAGEKILGVPYKYANVPEIYGKPLKIILVGYQEYEATVKFNIFDTQSEAKRKQIDLWKRQGIDFVKCSELLDRYK